MQPPRGFVFPLGFNLSVPRPAPVPANAYQSRAALLQVAAYAMVPRMTLKPLGAQMTTNYLPSVAVGMVSKLPGPGVVLPNPYQPRVW